MVCYAVNGERTYKDATIVFKVGDNSDIVMSCRGIPEWKETNSAVVYDYLSSEKWTAEITEAQADELHEMFMRRKRTK